METKNDKQLPDLSFARVLVVDDMPSIQVMAAGLMRKYKIQVDCVSSGQEAIDRVKSGTPVYNAVFMDNLMPHMDGIEAVRRIRELDTEYAKKLPIIAMTGEESAGSEELFLKSGFQVFMTKPISLAKLDPVLREWLSQIT